MIKSMTGFGRSEYSDGKRNIIVEIKSVNHRYFDISIKMPRRYAFAEDKVKNAVKAGKASKVFVASDSDPEIISPIIALANECGTEIAYVDTRAELGKMCGIDVKAACAVQTI